MASKPVFSKSEYAYQEIKRRILTEALPPGAVVSQEGLAAELSISTTPLREGLKRLATEGLVRLDTHRDARVTELSAEEARSIYEVRRAVDPLASALAATRHTADDAAAIKETLSRLRPLTGVADIAALTAHRDFHRAIYTASHNTPLVGILEGLWDKADRYRQVGLRFHRDSREDTARIRREHHALADAVLAGSAERAEQAMVDHIAGSLGLRAIEALTETPDTRPTRPSRPAKASPSRSR